MSDAGVESGGSEEPTKYGDHGYWDERYGEWAPEPYDWLFEWQDVKAAFTEVLAVAGYLEPAKVRILVVGCGNAPLSIEMYDDGYTDQVLQDTSPVVIDQMELWHQKRKGLAFEVGDVTNLEHEDGSFDVVLDKSLYDTIVCEDNGRQNTQNMYKEIQRVLKPGGLLLSLSLHIHCDILGVLYLGCYNWFVGHARLDNPNYEEAKENSERHTFAVAHKAQAQDHDDVIGSEGDSFVQAVLNLHDTRSPGTKKMEDGVLATEHLKRQFRSIALAVAHGYITDAQRSELKTILVRQQDHHAVARKLFKLVTGGPKQVPADDWLTQITEMFVEKSEKDDSDALSNSEEISGTDEPSDHEDDEKWVPQ